MNETNVTSETIESKKPERIEDLQEGDIVKLSSGLVRFEGIKEKWATRYATFLRRDKDDFGPFVSLTYVNPYDLKFHNGIMKFNWFSYMNFIWQITEPALYEKLNNKLLELGL